MSETEPKHGIAGAGKSFNPAELPERKPDKHSQPRPAPAPGVPISEEEYRRLKEAAKHAPPGGKNAPKKGRKQKGSSP